MKKTDTDITEYHKNFIAGIRYLMASSNFDTVKEAAEFLGLPKLSVYKIMDGSNSPTTVQGTTLCQKGGFSANWLFLNKGAMYYEDAKTLQAISKELKKLAGK